MSTSETPANHKRKRARSSSREKEMTTQKKSLAVHHASHGVATEKRLQGEERRPGHAPPPPTASPPVSDPPQQRTSRLHHPFKANFNDHFETSLAALKDVLPALAELRLLTRPSTPELFTLYDPYYCSGTIVSHWRELGISKVLHENRDFYADIINCTVPGPYDMLVTNPPFSDDHMEKMMNFLISQDKPWAFLAPDYIATKPWFAAFVRAHFVPAPPTGKGDINAPRPVKPVAPAVVLTPPPFLIARMAAEAEQAKGAEEASAAPSPLATPATTVGPEPFYVIPRQRYDFQHPTGAGNAHSHFKSMWYVWAGRRTNEVLRAARVALLKDGAGTVVVHGLKALEEGKHVASVEKRQNPQRRAQQQQQQHRPQFRGANDTNASGNYRHGRR